MSTEETKTDASTEVAKEETKKVTSTEPEKTIKVDVYGEEIELPLSKAKVIIQKRDEKSKGYNELKAKIDSAEKEKKEATEKAALLELMRKQDVTAVEETVAAKYKDTIQKFESKVFKGEISSALAKSGVLPEALQDATKLIMAEVTPQLDGDDVKLAGKKTDEFVAEWIKNKPHLVQVKAVAEKKAAVKAAIPHKPAENAFISITKGLSKLTK